MKVVTMLKRLKSTDSTKKIVNLLRQSVNGVGKSLQRKNTKFIVISVYNVNMIVSGVNSILNHQNLSSIKINVQKQG